MAAIWSAIATKLDLRIAGRLPEAAPTFAYLFLVPILGPQTATEVARPDLPPPLEPLVLR